MLLESFPSFQLLIGSEQVCIVFIILFITCEGPLRLYGGNTTTTMMMAAVAHCFSLSFLLLILLLAPLVWLN